MTSHIPVNRLSAAGLLAALTLVGCRGNEQRLREVTAYVSADRPFSEPIMQEYERQSGVRVNVVYDTEETKSTGLANRLLAEKGRPQADVFWSNEPVRTLMLKSRGAATTAPACTMGPSFPRGRPEEHENIIPNILHLKIQHLLSIQY